ncbi:MAG TPA: thioesterase domain-containing protein, partial [Caulobacteraceae bacterium]|nr:thioesterase domain-containing protein [Caulobacteraceae bacterium]
MSRPRKAASRPVERHGNAVGLKAGATTSQLFLFAGAGCEWREVAPLAALVEDPWSVIGIEAWRPTGSSTRPPRTVEEMADVAHQAVKAEQAHGPYNLAGFSFGGLVAFEVAGLLVRSGEQVELLALIDCHMHHRFWSVPQ